MGSGLGHESGRLMSAIHVLVRRGQGASLLSSCQVKLQGEVGSLVLDLGLLASRTVTDLLRRSQSSL